MSFARSRENDDIVGRNKKVIELEEIYLEETKRRTSRH